MTISTTKLALAGVLAFAASTGAAMAQGCPIKLGAILPVSGRWVR